jgi:hypothetical protein
MNAVVIHFHLHSARNPSTQTYTSITLSPTPCRPTPYRPTPSRPYHVAPHRIAAVKHTLSSIAHTRIHRVLEQSEEVEEAERRVHAEARAASAAAAAATAATAALQRDLDLQAGADTRPLFSST